MHVRAAFGKDDLVVITTLNRVLGLPWNHEPR
jgi:hypothetical protein